MTYDDSATAHFESAGVVPAIVGQVDYFQLDNSVNELTVSL